MKRIIFSVAFIFSIGLYAQKGNVNVELISYRVPIAYSIDMEGGPEKVNVYDVYAELFNSWYRNKIGPVEYDLFIRGVYEAATTGKITVYDPFYTSIKGNKVNFTPMSVDQVKTIGVNVDTTEIQYPYPPYDYHDTVFVREFDIYSIQSIDFLEKWTINSATMKMTKTVIAFAPVTTIYDPNTGMLRGMMPMFWVKM